MTKDLIISANRHETKVAILEDDQLVEIYFQRANEYSLVGSIHKGRVTRVLPGMQSAFVDVGLERDAFLYVSDFFEESDEYEPMASVEDRNPRRERGAPPRKERPPVAPAAAAPEAAAPPTPPAPPPAAKTAAATREDDDGKDRKGRRSRRRRNRGRGFPDSKYASDVAPPPAPPAPPAPQAAPPPKAAPPPPVPVNVQPPVEEFILLPGESLAKYRRAGASREPDALPPESEEAFEEGPELAGDELVAVPASDVASAREWRADIALDRVLSAETPIDASAAGAPPLAEEAEEADAPVAGIDEEDEEPEEAFFVEELETADEEPDWAEEGAEAEGPDEIGEQEEETAEPNDDLEIQDLILEQLSEEGPAEIAEATIGEELEKQPPAAAAKVRERDQRYMHRMPRRSRRRGGRPEQEAADEAPPARPPVNGGAQRPDQRTEAVREKPPLPSISDLLREGQEIIVQVAKEPLGQKGARITSHVALPGRYVVYMPTLDHLGVSRKVASDEERHRLRRILQTHGAGISGGFIVRTAGEGKPEAEIAADMSFLYNLWLDIRKKAEKKPSPCLLHHDLQVVERVLRDQVTSDFKSIWVDHEDTYESVLQFLQRFQPALMNRVRMYTRSAPIFDSFNISSELEKALRPKVWLKSGGYIVINQTEALVAIDINTGKFVGKSNRLEDTIVKTNVEAVKEISRQMRLRDLGGIIVVDFIDMDERKNRSRVMQALEEAMRSDRAPYKVLQFNDFGLVAITRKRVKQSLERTLCSPCPYCEGAAYVKSVDTIIGEILLEAYKVAPAVENDHVILRVHPDVAKQLKSGKNDYMAELEEILGRPVLITADALLHHEKFDWA